jgi:hypothetical protein
MPEASYFQHPLTRSSLSDRLLEKLVAHPVGDLQHSREIEQVEHYEIDAAPDTNDSSPGHARAGPVAQSKKR